MRTRVSKADRASSPWRWLWYVLIGVCLAIAVFIWASLSPEKYDNTYDRWIQFAILTASVFGYLLKWGWHYAKQVKLWVTYMIALTAHGAVLGTLFSYGSWPVVVVAVVGSIEIMTIAFLVAWLMGEKL